MVAQMTLIQTPGADRQGIIVCFYDYDTQWGADRSRSPGGPKQWGHRDFENTDALLELHAKYRVPACFAVVGAAALPGSRPYHDPQQIRAIHAAGHEIASHSFRHEWLPGLDRAALHETLRSSKQALEDCIGAAVTSFVPPFNQPFDYPAALAFSMSERREAGSERTDLSGLCRALAEEGYRFCRTSYKPWPVRLVEILMRRRLNRVSKVKRIEGITCLTMNAAVGFGDSALRIVRRCSERRTLGVAHAHPHSVRSGGPQDLRYLEVFLAEVARLRLSGSLEVRLPADLSRAEDNRLERRTTA
jgi:hypothetical protein